MQKSARRFASTSDALQNEPGPGVRFSEIVKAPEELSGPKIIDYLFLQNKLTNGHYKEKFECSFHSWNYCSRVTWIDCKNYLNFRINEVVKLRK